MSNLDDKKKPSTIINLSDNDEDEAAPPPAKQAKITKSIKKTNSAGAKLINNPMNSSTQSTTISTLLGIVNSPVKTNLTPQKPVQTLKPGSFHITLCVDNAEASRSTQKVLLEHLTKNSISFDVRKLNIGDFLWTVRCRLFIINTFLGFSFCS
jgi:ERCC4-type nuclease